MHKLFLQDVPLSHVSHNDLACYVAEGYGGEPIEKWPMYIFFKEYVSGGKDNAEQHFCDWYKNQLDRYAHTPKRDGGMYKGSLYNLIEHNCNSTFDTAEASCRESAIRARVTERFALLEKIRQEGYRPEAERIDGIKKNGRIYLCGGHHRAAILYALGNEVLPSVLVFPNQLMYNLFNFLRTLRYGNL